MRRKEIALVQGGVGYKRERARVTQTSGGLYEPRVASSITHELPFVLLSSTLSSTLSTFSMNCSVV